MIDQLMRSIPIDQIAESIGEDPETTRHAVQASLPALLGGLANNAESRSGAESLLQALGQHQDRLDESVSVDQIDVADGEKIVGHVFGGNSDSVVTQLGGLSGPQTSSIVRRLLPILAPIVLSWLAKQVGGAMQGGGARPPQSDMRQPDGPLGQGRTASVDSAQGEQPSNPGGPDLTSVLQDVLGSALGGSSRSSGGGLLGDVLGSILSGRR